MKHVLVLVASDPRRSERAAEGFRVADGLSIADDLTVAVLVCGAAGEAFSEPEGNATRWQDGSLLFRHAASLRGRGVPIHVAGVARPALGKEMGLLSVSEEDAANLRHGVDVAIEF